MDFKLLVFFITISSNVQDSYEQFPTNEKEIQTVAVEGLSENLEVTCGYNEDLGPPLWVINGLIYDLFIHKLSYLELDSLYSIRIPTVSVCLDNITFQCISSTKHPPGRITRIFVIENPNLINYPTCNSTKFTQLLLVKKLEIDTQNFIIGSNSTAFGFFSPLSCRSFQFFLLIFDSIETHARSIISLTCCSGLLPSRDLSTSNGDVSFLRIIAVMDNITCDSNLLFFYTFNDAQTNQSVIKSNESICFDFPSSTAQCDFSGTSLYLSVSSECNLKLTPENANVHTFSCYKEFHQFKVLVDYNNSKVCLYNWNLPSNHTTIHYLCISRCPTEGCDWIYNYVSSYEVFVELVSIPTTMATTEEVNTVPTSTHSDAVLTTFPTIATVLTPFPTIATSNSSAGTSSQFPPFAIGLIVVAVIVVVIGISIGFLVWKYGHLIIILMRFQLS